MIAFINGFILGFSVMLVLAVISAKRRWEYTRNLEQALAKERQHGKV